MMSNRIRKGRATLHALALALLLVPATVEAQASKTVRLAGKVGGASGAHTVCIALWRAEGFAEKPVQTLVMRAGSAPEFSFAVVPGDWAVSAFEDMNENGVLDMGWFGPKEPSGFWRPFTGHRKPTFKDVSFSVEHDTSGIDIRLK